MNTPHDPEDHSSQPQDSSFTPGRVEREPDDQQSPRSSSDYETTGDAALDTRLSEPVFQGYRGIETAQFVMSAFLVAVVGVIVYSNSLGGEFTGHDRTLIVENEALHRLSALPDAVRSSSPGPLAVALLSLNWLFTPASVPGFQVVNIFLHLMNAVLLFAVARTLLRSRTSEAVCMTSGLVLAVLPMATESVNYLIGRGALLATLFSCAALLFAYRATAHPGRIGVAAMLLSVLCHLAAAASAAQAVLLPLVTLAYVWTVRGPALARPFVPWSGWLVVLQAALLVVLHAMMAPLPGRLIATPSIMATALVDAVFPFRLSVAHGLPLYSYVLTFLVLFFFGSFVAALLVLRRRAGLPLLWFATFSLAGAVVTPPGDVLAGRHLYLPLAGILLLIPWGLVRIPAGTPRVVAGIGVAILTLVSGWLTLHRNSVWTDPVELWAEASELYPDAFEPRHELGRLQVLQGQGLTFAANQWAGATADTDAAALRQEAEAQFTAGIETLKESVALGDPHAEVRLLLADAYLQLGRGPDAEEALLGALAVDPANLTATLQLASLLEARATTEGDVSAAARALAYYERARAVQPLSPERSARFGMLLASVGRFDDAAAALADAVQGRPASPYAEAFQVVQEKLKQVQDLEQFAAEQVRAAPGDLAGLRAAAQAKLIRGQYLDASYLLEKLRLQYPHDYGTWMLLGLARAKMHSAEEFVRQHSNAPSPADENVSPWMDLAERAAGMGSGTAAAVYLSRSSLSALERALTEARWAVSQGRREDASAALETAKQADTEDPRPWLLEADLALTGRDPALAETALAEAERRGATAADVEERRRQIRQAGTASGEQPGAPAEAAQ